MKKSIISLKFILALALIALVQIATVPSNKACASSGAAKDPEAGIACDPAFFETLQQRAWREAQREVMANETFIFKPDSVFALSCFHSMVKSFEGTSVNTTFSNNSGKLDPVFSILDSYMSRNFNHGFLGGKDGGGQAKGDACSNMRSIWLDLKCRNLTLANFQAFNYSADPYNGKTTSADPRIDNWKTCTTNPVSTWKTTNERMKTVGAIKTFVEGTTFDSARLYLPATDPLNLLDPKECSAGIPTGVAIGTGTSTYAEIVCPNPGCVPKYEGSALVCKPQ